MYMKRHIIMSEKWSGLPVSALTLPSVVFSPLITDLVFLSQFITMTWNAWSGSERRVSLGGKSCMGQTKTVTSMGKLLHSLSLLPPPPLQSDLTCFRIAGLDLLRDSNYYLYNLDVCCEAARIGRLKILQYAVEDGCPWIPEKCLEEAEENEHEDVVKWITDGPPQPDSSLSSLLLRLPRTVRRTIRSLRRRIV